MVRIFSLIDGTSNWWAQEFDIREKKGKRGKKERCGVQKTGIIGGAVEDEEEEDKRGGFPSPHISSFD